MTHIVVAFSWKCAIHTQYTDDFQMMKSESIQREFNIHLKQSRKRFYSDFYVGITRDVEKRLFEDHKVDKNKSWWIYAKADSSHVAREVEKYYLDLGMRGGSGGGDDNSDYVYCYAITPTTIE